MQSRTNTLPELSAAETCLWRELIQGRCGLAYSEDRLRLLRQALGERVRVRRLRSFGEYYRFVTHHPEGQEEWGELLELLVNQETSFFRHQPSFEALTGRVLPRLLGGCPKETNRPVTLWSAGCATGQEPYSLAMACLEAARGQDWRTQVWGTDISQRALARARRGWYTPFELRCLPEHWREKYLEPASEGTRPGFRVTDRVRSLVQFDSFNLNDPTTYGIWGLDVVFCHNVLIYFRQEARAAVVRQLGERLNPGGYLFLGPAEAVGLKVVGLEFVRNDGLLIYQRPL